MATSRWDLESRIRSVGSDPDARLTLANERTFLGWIRTSLALSAAGVALDYTANDPASTAVGVALLLLAAGVSVLAFHRWLRIELAMREGRSLPVTLLVPMLAYGIALLAAVALIVVLVT